ncbi:TonB family protein [uncultured Nitratireductor sp.]|uniref:TonB family protein n=1 Tax=uncultured Nitratireductor sp. TaxID=520953 RepID=UPI0025D69E4B|nr:TonB family protein [uncultured Nitratireductor sp.]
MSRPAPVEIAGGGATEIAIAGNAFADMVAAGETTEEIEPQTEPVQPEAVSEVTPDTQVDTATATPIETVTENVPAPVVEAEQPVVENAETETAEEAVEPVENAQVVTALADVPVPTPRPAYTPPPKPKVQKKKPARTAKAAPPKKRNAGSKGRDRQDARRGTAGQRNDGKASKGRQVARASKSGNARVSNYPGKVVSKLRRSLRYPSAAKRQRLKGEVRVRFTIARNGSVSGIRIVRSSGSNVLDKAALDTVRRAAPFPRIPDGAGRSSWGFTVPLAFRR